MLGAGVMKEFCIICYDKKENYCISILW
jgi:hypothetical protein